MHPDSDTNLEWTARVVNSMTKTHSSTILTLHYSPIKIFSKVNERAITLNDWKRSVHLFKEKEPTLIRLIELRVELADKSVKIKVQVVGESHKIVCCKTVTVECASCGAIEHFDLADPKNYKLLHKRLRFEEDKFKQRLHAFPICNCKKSKRKVSLDGSLDYRVLY